MPNDLYKALMSESEEVQKKFISEYGSLYGVGGVHRILGITYRTLYLWTKKLGTFMPEGRYSRDYILPSPDEVIKDIKDISNQFRNAKLNKTLGFDPNVSPAGYLASEEVAVSLELDDPYVTDEIFDSSEGNEVLDTQEPAREVSKRGRPKGSLNHKTILEIDREFEVQDLISQLRLLATELNKRGGKLRAVISLRKTD